MILVIGATGALGGEICRQLVAAGKPVRAMVRPTADESKVDALTRLGCVTVEGDLKDRASLDRALRGVDTVVTTASTTFSRQPGDSIRTVDRDGQLALVAAARAAEVAHFIYVSFSAALDLPCPLTEAKRAVEAALEDSGMTYTILRPSYFMESWLSPGLGFDVASATAQIFGTGEKPVSYISLVDVAAFAVAAVDAPAARNAEIELGGPEAVSPMELVRANEELLGRPFAVQHVPEEALQAQYDAAADPLEKSFAALMLQVARGNPIRMDDTLRRFPVRLTSAHEFTRRAVGMPVG